MARLVIRPNDNGSPVSVRPLYIMRDEGVTETETKAVMYGINAVLRAAGNPMVPVYDLGVWRSSDWLYSDNTLAQWHSVDWYITDTLRRSRKGQLHGGEVLRLLYEEPWQEFRPHYDVLVTSHDIYDDGCNFCIGLAIHRFGTVISTARWRPLVPQVGMACLVTATMHEIGHVFDLVPATRKTNVEYSLGLHCTNRCLMRQGLSVPNDWLAITADRLRGYEFCGTCRRDLRRYFGR